MKLHTLIVTCITLTLLGCTSVHYVPYVGDQSDWPTRPGALAEEIKGVPVYYGAPSKPYTVMGQMELSQNHKLAPSALNKAASEAQKRGADALIVLDRGQTLLGVSSSGGGSIYNANSRTSTYSSYGASRAHYGTTAVVLLIKFRSP